MSRILLWSPGYRPELIGIPPLVTEAAEWLCERGHDVDVVAPMPNNPTREIHPAYRGTVWRTEELAGVSVHRSWLRVRPRERIPDKVLWEATFATLALRHVVLRLPRTDVLVCVVPPLLGSVYGAMLVRLLGLAGRRVRLVLWIQDLVLKAAESVGHGSRRAAGWLTAVAARPEAAALQAADAVVVCSPGFADYVTARGVSGDRISLLYNWVDTDWLRPMPSAADGRQARFLYAGNLGYTQGFETLVEAARRAGSGIGVDIVGAGNSREDVEALAATAPNVRVRQPVPREKLPELLAAADVHVLVQRRVSAGANLPSKIATYLASGRPVIASIDPATPAAALLEASGAAVLVEPESPAALARAMLELARDPVGRAALGARARQFAERHLSKEAALSRLERVLLA